MLSCSSDAGAVAGTRLRAAVEMLLKHWVAIRGDAKGVKFRAYLAVKSLQIERVLKLFEWNLQVRAH